MKFLNKSQADYFASFAHPLVISNVSEIFVISKIILTFSLLFIEKINAYNYYFIR